jgi:hypothetical protein
MSSGLRGSILLVVDQNVIRIQVVGSPVHVFQNVGPNCTRETRRGMKCVYNYIFGEASPFPKKKSI